MADLKKSQGKPDAEPADYTGPERRSGLDRRQGHDLKPPVGQVERRRWVRRKADRLAMEQATRVGGAGAGGRLYQRVRIQVPVVYRPLREPAAPGGGSRRGATYNLAPGGLGMLLDEEFPVGTIMEVLVRFEEDLLAADVQVVSMIPQGSLFLLNCRFTRLGAADRDWLTEYLRIRDRPHP
jgi:hypothetical protein